MKELVKIQQELNAPKSRYNSFGKYNYRSCEDILEGLKPLLLKYNCVLLLSDEVKEVGSRYTYGTQEQEGNTGKTFSTSFEGTRIYVEATATIINPEGEKISVKAYAREEVAKKGMDGSQITGSASSYARKYALNGLFAIDDTKDADALNTNPEYTQKPQAQTTSKMRTWHDEVREAKTEAELTAICYRYPYLRDNEAFKKEVKARMEAINNK